MNSKQSLILFISSVLVVAVLVAVSFAVDWYPVSFRQSWNSRASGFCSVESQCLVSPGGSHSFDSMPEKYFSQTKPYCINNSQYILDFYCVNGNWSSRTKLIAVELLKFAESQSSEFSLFCGPADSSLNNINYQVSGISVNELVGKFCHPFSSSDPYSCVNSVCVLKYGNSVAFGTSLNIPVDDSDRSFLKTLGKSAGSCDSAKNFDNDFDLCSDNIWYNHNTASLIVLPESYLGSALPSSSVDVVSKYFTQPFGTVSSFVSSSSSQSNISFINSVHLFNNLYFARKDSKEVFGFMERDQTFFSYDYFGILMKGIDLNGYSLCRDIVNIKEDSAMCRDSPDVVFVSKKTPDVNQSLVNYWVDATAKLRLK